MKNPDPLELRSEALYDEIRARSRHRIDQEKEQRQRNRLYYSLLALITVSLVFLVTLVGR